MLSARLSVVTAGCLLAMALPGSAWKQDRFIITFWCAPPAIQENLAAVAAEGYNLTWAPAEALDLVEKHGLKALLQDPLINPAVLDTPEGRSKLDELIKRVRNHPALEGYFITDEPGSGAFPGLSRLVAFIRERDPEHLAYINLFPTYATKEQLGVSADAVERAKVGIPTNFAGAGANAEVIAAYRDYLNKFIDIVKPELISYDHYHFLKTGDGCQYFLNLELIREASLRARLPFLNIIQACTIEPSWRLVNKNELRFLIFTTLAYGGRGISYFLYWGPESYGGLYRDGKRTPLAVDVAHLNRTLIKIGNAMLHLESRGVYHTKPLPIGAKPVPPSSPVKLRGKGEYVLGLFGNKRKTTAFMIVNRDYKSGTRAQVELADRCLRIEEFDPLLGTWSERPVDRLMGEMFIDLDPGEGRLFRMVQTP
ncbi:MAG: hypothetical protein QHI38_11960 [Armatimonadota bacterium]|nr:hypothetical protein [Armatimonadota bacterium]